VPLYATFEAARRLLDRIEQDAAHHVASPPPSISGTSRRLLDIRSLLWVSGNNGQVGERMNFQIIPKCSTLAWKANAFCILPKLIAINNQILLKFSRPLQQGPPRDLCLSSTMHQNSSHSKDSLVAGSVLPWNTSTPADRILDSEGTYVAMEKTG
jgi:hypothetical protein